MTLYQSRETVTLSDNTTKIVDLTVPLGKIWKVHAIMMHNGDDVSRNLEVQIINSSSFLLHYVSYASSVSSGDYREMISYESSTVGKHPFKPLIIKGGNKLRLKWNAGGTSSGGTAYYCVTYEEIPE